MPNTRSRRGIPTSREMPADIHLRHLTTEVLRLRFGQLNLVTTCSRSVLLTNYLANRDPLYEGLLTVLIAY